MPARRRSFGRAPRHRCVRESRVWSQVTGEPAGEDSLVDAIFGALQEQSRLRVTNELRRFSEVDNQEVVNLDDLEKTRRQSRTYPGRGGRVDTS